MKNYEHTVTNSSEMYVQYHFYQYTKIDYVQCESKNVTPSLIF